MRADPRTDNKFLTALDRVAPGTEVRAGVDDIIRAQLGALVVVGEPSDLAFLFSGGMRIDLPFTAQHLYELAKMDGAIIVDSTMSRLVYANVQLMPDANIPARESGMRHRTAERVAIQTDALVLAVSQQRETLTLFIGDDRYQLGRISDILGRTNQALATLDTYRTRLNQALTRLTALEFQNAVTLDNVLVVLQRAEMATRIAAEIELDCAELGQEGRLVRMQMNDLMEGVSRDKTSVVLDYQVDTDPARAMATLEQLGQLPTESILGMDDLGRLLGFDADLTSSDESVSPRGYRMLSRVPRLPEGVIRQVVRDLGSLDAIVRASHRELELVEGVGTVRAREIRDGLRRLREHNLVDRYLKLQSGPAV